VKAVTTITLRDPDEKILVEEGGKGWINFGLTEKSYITLIGSVPGRLRSVPWWRVIEIDTEGARGVEEHPQGGPHPGITDLASRRRKR
jgi:hypothetical protein